MQNIVMKHSGQPTRFGDSFALGTRKHEIAESWNVSMLNDFTRCYGHASVHRFFKLEQKTLTHLQI